MKTSKTTVPAKSFEVGDEVIYPTLGKSGTIAETCHKTNRCQVLWRNTDGSTYLSTWINHSQLDPFVLEELPPPIAPAPTSLPHSTSKMTYKQREYYIHGNPSAARYWYVIDGVHSAQAFNGVVAANIAARKAIDLATPLIS